MDGKLVRQVIQRAATLFQTRTRHDHQTDWINKSSDIFSYQGSRKVRAVKAHDIDISPIFS